MDAELAVSTSFVARVKRFFNDRVAYGNRSGRPRLIALTFDDGPYPIFTPLLLNELRSLGVPATFFFIGQDAKQWPELTQRTQRYGEEIADHTLTHPNLDQESAPQVRAEILQGRDAISALARDPAVLKFFRPPHGRYNVETIRTAQSIGYTTVLWTDDGGDWRVAITPARLAAHLERYATAPEIVLLHSGKLATIQMLPEVVKRFHAAGYRFVTVGTLLTLASPADLNHPLKQALRSERSLP